MVRLGYRARQFWHLLTAAPQPEELQLVEQVLSREQLALFRQQQPGEQAHSLWIFHELQVRGESNPDLLVAALLHDAGKSRCPLTVWERVVIVLAKALAPEKAHAWGRGEPQGWKRPFVVAEQHADWGASLAEQAGCSALTVNLIRRHQETGERSAGQPHLDHPEEYLLRRLQELDEKR